MVKVGILEENSGVSLYQLLYAEHPPRKSIALENGQKVCRQVYGRRVENHDL